VRAAEPSCDSRFLQLEVSKRNEFVTSETGSTVEALRLQWRYRLTVAVSMRQSNSGLAVNMSIVLDGVLTSQASQTTSEGK
jgi:hypothetical protein